MKRIVLILSALLLLSGCADITATELSNRLIIEAIGIDLSDEGYKVTVLALNTLQAGSANSTEMPDGISKVFSAKADSIAKAFAKTAVISGQIPLYSQARVLIIGKELAQNAPMKALDFFIREYTTRDDILLAVSDSSAEQIISVDLGKNMLASKVIQNILNSGELNGQTVAIPLYQFANNMLNPTDTAFLPVIKSEKNDSGKEELKTAGIALFPQKNHTVTIDENMTAVFLLAVDLIDNMLLDIDYKGNNISLALKRLKSDIKMTDKYKPSFSIHVSFSFDIIEYNNSNNTNMDRNDVIEIKVLAEDRVKRIIEECLNTTKENACDCFSFGRQLRNRNMDLYVSILPDYEHFIKNIDVKVSTTAKLLRNGREIIQYSTE